MGLLQILGAIFSPTVTLAGLALRPVFGPLFDYLGISNPIDRQRRVDEHRRKVECLLSLKDDLMRGDPYPSSEQTRTWLYHVDKVLKDAQNIQLGYSQAGYNVFNSWKYARAASLDTKTAVELINRYRDVIQGSNRLGIFRDVQMGGPVAQGPFMAKLDFFIKSDTSKSQGVLGIWGMAGVGKTTLLKSLYNDRWGYDSFQVLYVPVGRNSTVAELQLSIAQHLGLPTAEKVTLPYQINDYLMDKNFILMLDDLWDGIDLFEVGIPYPFGTVIMKRQNWVCDKTVHRKLIVTTRRLAACTLMDCGKNTLHMLCPNEQDAASLFCDIIGESVMKVGSINALARELIDECERLPVALSHIGRAMSSTDDLDDWRNAVELLKGSKLNEITRSHDLLNSLMFSYDHLERGLQPCFLICSLWCEGEDIPVDKLVSWWIGLGLLGADAYSRGRHIVRDLLDSSLLEKSVNSLFCTEHSHIRLHKMVRHMAVLTVKNILQESWVFCSSSRQAIPKESWFKIRRAWLSPKDTPPG